LIIGSNPRIGIFEIISKIALGLSRIYNTVKIPVKLILWSYLFGLHHQVKRSIVEDIFRWDSGFRLRLGARLSLLVFGSNPSRCIFEIISKNA
jgi:hypothetical protein